MAMIVIGCGSGTSETSTSQDAKNFYNARRALEFVGDVKSCEEVATGSSGSGYSTKTTYKFQHDGRLEYYSYETSRDLEEEFYDDSGRIIGFMETSNTGEVYTRNYSYASSKVIIKHTYDDGDQEVDELPLDTYNGLGLIAKTYSYDGRAEYSYDSKGNCTEYREYDNDGSLIKKEQNEYDASGRILMERIYEGSSLVSERKYSYSGKDVKCTEYEDGTIVEKSSYTLDGKGNIIQYESVNFSNGKRYSYVAEYHYDSHGNWIYKEIVNSFGRTSVFERKILYY